MSWGDNLLTNPSAETEDLTGWTSDNVTTEESLTVATKEDVYIKGLNVTMEPSVYFGIDGLSGEHAFVFASDSDAYMYQVLFASDIGEQPVNFQFVCRYKLKKQQSAWDNTVKGYAKFKIAYDDSTFDYFIMPLVLGIKTPSRYLTDFWILVRNTCAVNADKTLDYIEVRAEADTCTNQLVIDYFELRKEV